MDKKKIYDNLIYVTDKYFVFGLDDEKERQFGVIFEIMNMFDATGEKEFENYPYLVNAAIIVDKPHKSFSELDKKETTKDSLIYDMYSYMGGVPVNHTLVNDTNGGLDEVSKLFNVNEACINTVKHDFGTIAAQKGKGTEFKYLQFKTEEACEKYIDYIIEKRIQVLRIMIGFILDRQINMAGEIGWDVIKIQVKGKK